MSNKNSNTYRFTIEEYKDLKQIAYKIMQNKNRKEYNSKKPYSQKHYIKYKQTLVALYKLPNNKINKLIHEYHVILNKKLIQQNRASKKIITKIPYNKQQLQTNLRRLEQLYYLDLDIDYTELTSMQIAYQQLKAYKVAGIKLMPKQNNTILVGEVEILNHYQQQ